MASANLIAATTRDPGLIRVHVNHTLWADFCARSVFSDLALTPDAELSGGYWIHWRSRAYATSLLADARLQAPLAKGARITMYRRLAERLEKELEEAAIRTAWLRSDKPRALNTRRDIQRYVATRDQLAKLGAPIGLVLPGTIGGPSRKSTYRDVQDRLCVVLRADSVWPDCFFVEVHPNESRSTTAPKADAAMERLRNAPTSQAAYRQQQARNADAVARILMNIMDRDCGYEYAPSAIREIQANMLRLRSILLNGEVTGAGPGPLLSAREAKAAKTNKPLQSFLRLVSSSSEAKNERS